MVLRNILRHTTQHLHHIMLQHICVSYHTYITLDERLVYPASEIRTCCMDAFASLTNVCGCCSYPIISESMELMVCMPKSSMLIPGFISSKGKQMTYHAYTHLHLFRLRELHLIHQTYLPSFMHHHYHHLLQPRCLVHMHIGS